MDINIHTQPTTLCNKGRLQPIDCRGIEVSVHVAKTKKDVDLPTCDESPVSEEQEKTKGKRWISLNSKAKCCLHRTPARVKNSQDKMTYNSTQKKEKSECN